MFLRNLLYPLGVMYDLATSGRNWAYDHNLISIEKVDVPIISFGNLTMGGTGKTPLLCEILSWAETEGRKVGVVSRGYGGTYQGIVRVPNSIEPRIYGDEPSIIARQFPKVPIYLGRSKVKAAKELIRKESVDVIFVDDGFQHRSLWRDINILIIDVTEPIVNYRVLPWGRGRENTRFASRADVIIYNKVNLVSESQRARVLEWTDQFVSDSLPSPLTIECEYHVRQIRNLYSQEVINIPSEDKWDSLGAAHLVSAIGNPKSFEQMMRLKFAVKSHRIFGDHHFYTKNDVEDICKLANEKEKIIITEKDAIKIKNLIQTDHNIWVAELKPKMGLKVKLLYDKIRLLASK